MDAVKSETVPVVVTKHVKDGEELPPDMSVIDWLISVAYAQSVERQRERLLREHSREWAAEYESRSPAETNRQESGRSHSDCADHETASAIPSTVTA